MGGGWKDRQTNDGQPSRLVDEWVDDRQVVGRWMHGQIGGQTGGWMDGRTPKKGGAPVARSAHQRSFSRALTRLWSCSLLSCCSSSSLRAFLRAASSRSISASASSSCRFSALTRKLSLAREGKKAPRLRVGPQSGETPYLPRPWLLKLQFPACSRAELLRWVTSGRPEVLHQSQMACVGHYGPPAGRDCLSREAILGLG